MKVNGHMVRTMGEAHRLLRSGSLSCVELLHQVWEQIQANQRLNGLVSVRDLGQLEQEAAEADERYKRGTPLSPLDGIPLSIKDNMLQQGVETSAASKSLEGFVSPFDSTTVRRLRDHGAILVGSANMDEFGMGSYGLYGKNGSIVRNPIDEEYVAGGSSAGSACTVKSYQCYGSIGTDTGGSIGMPAHNCGLFGFKPSYGRVSRFGQILYSSSTDVNGPLCHSSEDIFHMFKAISGKDVNDSNCVDFSDLAPHAYRDSNRQRVLDQSILEQP